NVPVVDQSNFFFTRAFTLDDNIVLVTSFFWVYVMSMWLWWVVTSLRQTSTPGSSSSGFSWVFNLKGISDMYQSYEETNLWKIVEDVPRGVHVNFLKAERSLHRWALEDLQRIHSAEEQAADEGGGVEMHVLEDAGHWLAVFLNAYLFLVLRILICLAVL
ncbi:unnamed protein product, partial [Ilex paraguariensis]